MSYPVEGDSKGLHWFAVWTRSRQEKVASQMLESLGVSHYLPLKSEIRQWSDRKQRVSVPLFSGYLFVRMNPDKDSRLEVLKTPGIVGFVGNDKGPLPIPDEQIEAIREVLKCAADYTVEPYLKEGDRVRVARGVLAGIEGTLVRISSAYKLVVSIEMIQKSLVISVSQEDIEPVNQNAA